MRRFARAVAAVLGPAAARALDDGGGDPDCQDFASQAAAQAWAAAHGGSAARDVANLDHNRNGIACERYPYAERQGAARAARRGGAVAWGRAAARR
jgi:hypothetical protein